MNLDSLNFSLLQIHSLITNLNKKNYKQSAQELNQIVNLYGLEAENYLLRVLFTEAGKLAWDSDKNSSAFLSNNLHATLLATRVTGLLNHPAKATVLCRIVDQPSRTLQKILKTNNTLIHRISRLLKLTTAQDVVFSLTLRKSSSKTEVVAAANHHLKKRFLDLVQCYLDAERGQHPERAGLQECSPEVLHVLLLSLSHEGNKLAPVTRELFVNRLRKDIPRELVPIVLAPQLYPDSTRTPLEEMTAPDDMAAAMMDHSIADVILEIGYSFTTSVEECKTHMLNFGGREPTAIDVARTISMMIRYQVSNFPEAPKLQTPGNFWINHDAKKECAAFSLGEWNSDVFVKTLKELASNLNWKEVILQLDHPEFIVPDRNSLTLLFSILRLGLQSAGYPANIFPVEYMCRRWTNLDGQMSLVTNILKQPDVFSFADHPFHPVPIDLLKSPPEPDNKEAGTWRCMYLVELLLFAAERGYYGPVMDLFKVPMQLCPDVFMLTLLQVPPPITGVRQELFAMLIPIFLGNHPNSTIILLQAWHLQTPNLKPIIMHAMADWYLRGDCDQSKLSRILDVAQDLKALSLLLNMQSFSFVIDLACLASRREYLKLDKWLTDKIRDHGELFIAAMIKFLQWRCAPSPHMMMLSKPMGPEDQMPNTVHLPKVVQLPNESIAVMINCLQLCLPNVQQQDLQEAMYNVVSSCQALLMAKTRPLMNPGLGRQHPRMHEGPFQHAPMPAPIPAPLFAQHLDPLGALAPGVASISLAAPPPTFGMPGTLGQLIAAPGSPSRMLAAPPISPFAMMPIHPIAMGIARMTPMPMMEKPRMPQDPALQYTDFMINISKEVEDEANSYFQRIYNHPPHPTLSIEEVLEMLKKFQTSPESREREVFSCMLRNLFEEYKFFPQYPDKELHITAQLFGGIIERGLVPSYVSLGLALRFVLDALKKGEGSKMYYFGIAALDRFKTRLKDYHKYCEHVRAIPYFSEFPAHLCEYVDYGLQSQEPPSKPSGPVLPATLAAMLTTTTVSTVTAGTSGACAGSSGVTAGLTGSIAGLSGTSAVLSGASAVLSGAIAGPSGATACSSGATAVLSGATVCTSGITTSHYRAAVCQASGSGISKISTVGQYGSRPSIANATNIDTLLTATDKDDQITVPPEAVQDKTSFIFNNLSQLNLQTKCEELKEVLTEEYYPWLSQYLVMKRASIEQNFHALYSNFIDVMKVRDVKKMVTRETYRNIKVLLRSDKGIANFSDRSLLKNLGHWLGMITLAKNLPILYIDIELKALVLEAYHKGIQELLFVVPFVAKILESCAKSRVFKPPNPWTMGIMNVLAELHQEPNLKLNLKFEVEVLCKNLGLDINELKPALYLKDPEKVRTIACQMSQPEQTSEAGAAAMPDTQVMLPPAQTRMPPPNMMTAEEMAIAQQHANQLAAQLDTNLIHYLGLPEPKFTYLEVNITSTTAFAAKVNYGSHLTIFQTYPHLKQFIKPSIERSIQEWIHPVVDRAIKYALTTCEQIIRKDFSLDPDEVRLRTCAHHMMRNLTAGMAMITCREQIITTITTNMKDAFTNALLPSAAPHEMIEGAAAILATDNMELACAFIQKTAVEKALPELDKRLISDFDVRKLARADGRRYYDPIVMTYQTERLPERVRLRVGGPGDEQIVVYEEFACNIPGFLPIRDANLFMPKPTGSDQMPLTYSQVMNPSQLYGTDEMSTLCSAAEQFLQNCVNMTHLTIHASNMHSLLECLIIARRNRDNVSGWTLLQKAVDGLLEGHLVPPGTTPEHIEMLNRYRDIHLRTLRLLEDVRVYGHVWTTKQITYCITECREEMRYNLEAVDCLIRNHLINLPQYDLAVSHMMENGNNYVAVSFAMQLVQLYLVDDRNNIYVNESDLYHVTDMLIRIMSQNQLRTPLPEGLVALIEMLRVNQDPSAYLGERSPLGPTAHIHTAIMQVRMLNYDDPPGLVEKTESVLREWQVILRSPLTEIELGQNFNLYVHRMNINGILKSDDLITRFLRIATQMVIQEVYMMVNEDRVKPPQNPQKRDRYYVSIDNFVKLISLLIKNTPDNGNPTPKLNLLNKMLGTIAGCLLQDHEARGNSFHQLPYFRLMIILYLDMNMADPVLESINYQVLTAFCHTLRIVKPSAAPGFAYAWLDFVSHRAFINRILAVTPQQKGWGMYSTLLIDLFKFMHPFLRNTELASAMTVMYKGTLKVLLVLLHDFPEFLCDYHYGFCDEIASNCIQMRNLILSAFPRNMRLPDPFTPNLKVDLLSETVLPPRAVINYAAILPNTQFKKDLDVYLKDRSPVTFLSELRDNMQIINEAGCVYNKQLMNAVVLYVGTQAIGYIRSKGLQPSMTTIAHSPHMDIFQNITVAFDFEGRYLFLNAIANQLRYPNSHTHYFSCALLYLFAEANIEAVQEQITRMLLERLIVNRPHPWGLLVTFIELIKNPVYNFWSHEFVHCAPEIEKLFASVARSCITDPTKPVPSTPATATACAPVSAPPAAAAAAFGSGEASMVE